MHNTFRKKKSSSSGIWWTLFVNVVFLMKLEKDTIEGFGPLHKVMEYEDQWCLGLFLLEIMGKVVGTMVLPHKLNKKQSQLSLAPSLL